jgi:hypothetical protein
MSSVLQSLNTDRQQGSVPDTAHPRAEPGAHGFRRSVQVCNPPSLSRNRLILGTFSRYEKRSANIGGVCQLASLHNTINLEEIRVGAYSNKSIMCFRDFSHILISSNNNNQSYGLRKNKV